ncbi:MAG: GAF domain-containing protein, partial [Limosilactobacillus fermentum]
MTAGQPQPLQTYQELVNRLYQQSNYDFVGVALQAPVSPHLTRWLFVAGNQNERFRRIVLRRGIGIAGLVLRTGAPFWHNDILALDLSDRLYSPIARAENLQAVVAVPINDGPL